MICLFSCFLFWWTISAGGGCVWVCCPVVPLLLGGPFFHLPGCEGWVLAASFSLSHHLSLGINLDNLYGLCLWEVVMRYWFANQHGSVPSASMIRSLQIHWMPRFQWTDGMSHMLLLSVSVLSCSLGSLPVGFWHGCQIPCSLGTDQMQCFLRKCCRSSLQLSRQL